LSPVAEQRRRHGGRYDAINAGRIEIGRLRRTLAGLSTPRMDGQITLAVDISPWPPPAVHDHHAIA
jgi:hypothetical protein